jgi:hypothetical protein
VGERGDPMPAKLAGANDVPPEHPARTGHQRSHGST